MEVGRLWELTGLARLKEALETNDWEGDDADGLGFEGLDLGEDDGDGEGGFEAEVKEVEREMLEMRRAIYVSGEGRGDDGVEGAEEEEEEEERDIQVEELESMMLKMQAIRDMGADMPSSERKRFAAKAVRDIMKSL
ncbi:Alpha/gamma-adaptin-binding protein p34 [Lasallia pustulata]|uniref:Alpha/gamma-adaptin-binding protein p34 n=1 Tax=Lasallia pustulata TaxID=136370 RepID=A0A1W5D3M9_9LECA|nr:Alpha/gamma-adaptin-binding protein p34 [Lasallia pustulata]